jgi:hypothetical protein
MVIASFSNIDNAALIKGCKLSNKGVHIILEKDGGCIVFDTLDPTKNGVLITVRMVPIQQFQPKKSHKANDMRILNHTRSLQLSNNVPMTKPHNKFRNKFKKKPP